jgi:hypothetical protein
LNNLVWGRETLAAHEGQSAVEGGFHPGGKDAANDGNAPSPLVPPSGFTLQRNTGLAFWFSGLWASGREVVSSQLSRDGSLVQHPLQ